MDAHPPLGTVSIDHLGIVTPARFFERMQKAGITTAAALPYLPDYPNTEHALQSANESSAALAQTYPDAYLPGIFVHPAYPACSCRELECCGKNGVRLLGEIQPHWLGDSAYANALAEIFSCAEQYRMVVSMHPENREQLCLWASRFPKLQFLYGDRQCRSITPAMSADLLQTYPNLYLRLSQDIFLGNYYLHTFVSQFPKNQILFGSGYPHSNPAARVAACIWELRDQDEDVRQQVFTRNAEALICNKGSYDVSQDY